MKWDDSMTVTVAIAAFLAFTLMAFVIYREVHYKRKLEEMREQWHESEVSKR